MMRFNFVMPPNGGIRIPLFSGVTITILAISALTHAAPRDELKETESALEQSKSRQASLARKRQSAEEEYRSLQAALAKAAKEMQEAESDLLEAEEKNRIIAGEIARKQDDLKRNQSKLATMLDASIRLSRTPPEAAVLMPGDFGEAMKASSALEMVSEEIRKQAAEVSAQLNELAGLKEKAEQQRQSIAQRQAQLDEQQKKLTKDLAARKTLQAKLDEDSVEEAARAKTLARKSTDLRELLGKLEEEKKTQEAKERKAREVAPEGKKPQGKIGKRSDLRSFAKARGSIRLPAAGRLLKAFDVAEGINETTRGVTLATRPNAQVSAPYDAEVVFTGPFLGYGKLIILRHSDGFHTLLAGLSRIDANVGQFLLEGEPIGDMGDGGAGNRLYVELRRNNQPVDPAVWIKGL